MAGFTPRQIHPTAERELFALGYGITNVVRRASAAADELADAEMVAGGKRLRAKVKRYAPRFLAVLGIGAYRVAFGLPKADVGLQPEAIGGTRVWVLPNPSGLNAHYAAGKLAAVFAELFATSRPGV
ncbi:mismatch-specific DNA-glycosylase [Limnoglobus roseus]|uniref:G/U mismatch-specific DNA glycosylase n=1 Tax=Limnoglobus roseus TaxID=2598579 RepID=A0A5C1AAF5_9BACT|nr:G/U mismatch-specific DNA glycosylase [Limnoglobus roseus]